MPAEARRVKDLFVAALELTDEQARQTFLDRECAGDAELRRRLEALLHANDEPLPALDRPLADVVPPEPATVAEELPGNVFAGRYKLVERIGEGGMGSVWMAQQTEPVKRSVAVKLIKAGGDSKAVVARFEAERQALALMDHPNIAKVLDGGTTDNGRPFFVMELVKGVRITEYCDARKLTPRQRLELFVPVCQAIQHAHQKGIIHRDIKPSNVLVAMYDDKPVPKVIDFGVAKAAGAHLTEQTLVTGFGALVGTPQYMSPEQATLNNLDVDTRSDIYSLGALLYELLAGSPPFLRKELEKAGMLEILRVIREVEPPRPSTKVSTADALPSLAANRSTEPTKLKRQLRGEIDWIVMKALDKERSRRYETANGFAMDIQRYLADEPVLAGPPSAAYRLKKFAKRNKGPVLAAALVLLALLAGMAGTTAGLVYAEGKRRDAEAAQKAEADRAAGERQAKLDADKARQEAQRQRDKALQAVDDYFMKVSQNQLLKSPLPGMQPLRKELLTAALKYYQEFAEQYGTDPRLQRELAAAYLRTGQITDLIDSPEQALPSLRKALALYEQLERDDPEDLAVQRGLADAEAALAWPLSRRKGITEALQLYERATARGEKLARAQLDNPKASHDLAVSYNHKALLLSDMSKPNEAQESYDRALALLKKLTDDHPDVAEYRITLAGVYSNIGEWRLYSVHEPARALKDFESAVAVQDKLSPVEAGDVTAQEFLAMHYCGIANCYYYLADKEKSLAANQRFTGLLEKLARENPRVTRYQYKLAMAYVNLGQLLHSNDRYPEARQTFQQAIDVGVKGLAANPNEDSFAFATAQAYGSRCDLLVDDSHFQEAAADAEKAIYYMNLAIDAGPHVPSYRLYIGNYFHALGEAQWKMKQPEAAQKTWQRGPEVWEKFMKEHPENVGFKDRVAEKLLDLAMAQGEAGLTEDMRRSWRRAAELCDAVTQAKPDDLGFRTKLASRAQKYGKLVLEQGRPEEAREAVQKAVELQQFVCAKTPQSAPDLRLLAGHHVALTDVQVAARKSTEALDSLRAARETLEKVPQPSAADYYQLACVCGRSSALLEKERPEQARQQADQAVERLTQALRAGYKDAKHIKEDKDLAPLRSRADFNKLLAELESMN
jgi:serine/threonine protein kinase